MTAFLFALLGGNFVNSGNLPDALERLSLLTPNGWALRGFTELSLDRSGLADISLAIVVLVAIGIAAGGAALLRFRGVVGR
jgi:ABC-2 type transport system permease protein